MNTVDLDVQGMSCGSCIAKVTDALNELPGVDAVEVHLTTGHVRVRGNFDQGNDPLLSKLQQAGYPALVAGRDRLSSQSTGGGGRSCCSRNS
ncbi:heavy-metal-associated domain-containing protein [Sodalis sp. RH20]|jgi:copper chaperone CopZ|uniref:heavy-metal-associated domain-containing protein n=1 Tax=unclassified Sodalis (in: enterobacteria) TaxID=2636512 RepID=UPI0039B518D1